MGADAEDHVDEIENDGEAEEAGVGDGHAPGGEPDVVLAHAVGGAGHEGVGIGGAVQVPVLGDAWERERGEATREGVEKGGAYRDISLAAAEARGVALVGDCSPALEALHVAARRGLEDPLLVIPLKE